MRLWQSEETGPDTEDKIDMKPEQQRNSCLEPKDVTA